MRFGVGDNTILNGTCSLFGRIDDVAEGRDDLLQFGIGIRCILPYLISLRSQVHIIIVIIVEGTTLFIIHIAQVLLVALEEYFIASHDVGILIDTGIQPGAQADNTFNTLCREE